MAMELEGNLPLQRFIQLLADLNHQSSNMIKTGDMAILPTMNKTVEEMYSIQHGGKEDAYTAIEEEMQTICKNFDAITMMLQSNDSDRPDKATSNAVKKFLHNIHLSYKILILYNLSTKNAIN